MSNVLKILSESAAKKQVPGIPDQKLNQPVAPRVYTGSVGIEIELEGTNLPNAGYLDTVLSPSGVSWLVKNDGSLRGGLEYVLSAPCPQEEVNYLVNSLYEVFTARRTTLTPSNRCSIHVHYNVGGLKVNAITSIIALWTVFEEPLLRWWGDARYKNHFCLSSKDEGSNVEAWSTYLHTGSLPDERGLRYTALNLVAIRKYGSVEFRGGGAVNDPHTAITWARFLHRLCEYAKATYQNPHQLAYDLSERGADRILEDICGEEFNHFFREVLVTVPDFNRCCTESFHNIQPVIFGFPWEAWLPEIEKEYIPNPFEKAGKKRKSAANHAFLDAEQPRRANEIIRNVEYVHVPLAAPELEEG